MKWYLEAKLKIKYDECYSNRTASKYLAKARTNSLQVREVLGRTKENRKNNYDTTYQLCGEEEENLEHFMIKCNKLEGKRDREIMDTLKSIEGKRKLPHLLFEMKDWEKTSNMVYKLWHLRKILLKPP